MRMNWVGHVVHMGEEKYIKKIRLENLRIRDLSDDLCVDGVVLKYMAGK